jgi:preprotein translocase subunit SecD
VTGDTSTSLPCFPTKEEATVLKDGLKVVDETTEYCVVSSDQQSLGCFLDQAKAQVELQRTGQGELLRIIGTTARLEEREVLSSVAPNDPSYAQLQVTCDNDPATTDIPDCPAKPDELAGKTVVFLGEDGTKYQLSEVKLEGDRIASARAVYRAPSQGSVTAGWVVDFTLTGEGAKEFGDLTTALVGRQLAIVLDSTVISAPTIQGAITGGTGQITGNFTEDRAKSLAAVLQAGALPVELERQQVQTVSPTLGKESLDQGIKAAVVGLVALLLYLLFYYRLLGVVAWFGMSIWAILAIALVSLAGDWFGYSLTLAGVAGLVISLGVTADSYIVFFERLKDEVRHGRSPRAAVQPAFKRAYKTIVAADIVTGLAAAILYVTAVSQVRGFALTLGVATALDLFVVWFFKRPTVFLIARSDRLVKMRGFGLTSGVAGDAEVADAAPVPVSGGAAR